MSGDVTAAELASSGDDVVTGANGRMAVSARPSLAERLEKRLGCPDAFLSRTDLVELGLERRAVDAVFRAVPTVQIPGYSRPLIRVSDFLRSLEGWTYRDDRVVPR